MSKGKLICGVSEEQGYKIIEDARGGIHILKENEISFPPITIKLPEKTHYPFIFICGGNTANFQSSNSFCPIPNLITGTSYLRYIVNSEKKLLIENISIVQSREGLALLGIYQDNILISVFPFFREANHTTELIFPGGMHLEFKIKPDSILTRVGLSIKASLI